MTHGRIHLLQEDKILSFPTLACRMSHHDLGEYIILHYLSGKYTSPEDLAPLQQYLLDETGGEGKAVSMEMNPKSFINALIKTHYSYVFSFEENAKQYGDYSFVPRSLALFHYDKLIASLPMPINEYVLTLSLQEDEADLVLEALEAYSSLNLGQYRFLLNKILPYPSNREQRLASYQVEQLLLVVRSLIFLNPDLDERGIDGHCHILSLNANIDGALSYTLKEIMQNHQAFDLVLEAQDKTPLATFNAPKNHLEKDGDITLSKTTMSLEYLNALYRSLDAYIDILSLNLRHLFSNLTSDPIATRLSRDIEDILKRIHQEPEELRAKQLRLTRDQIHQQILDEILK